MLVLSVFLITGCGGSGGGGEWDEPVPVDTVSFTVPVDGAVGVPVGNRLTVTFSEAMDPATINTTTFILKQGTTPISGTVAYTGLIAVFTPLSNLEPSTTYTATITRGAKNLDGNPLARDYSWSFTTGATVDTTKPRVTLTVPADTAAGVETNTKITATFTEDMNPLTITAAAFTVVNTTLGGTAVAGNVTYAVAARTATFTPTTPATLPSTNLFTATINTAAEDLGGNQLAGNQAPLPAASDYVWTFTTGAAPDTTAPTVTLTNPANLDTGVAINSTINATFSEAMDPDVLSIGITTFTLKETVSGASKLGTVAYNLLTNIATFTPQSNLTANTSYTATITTGAKDLAGNALVPGLVSNPWTFTTAAAPVVPLAINLGAASSFGIASRAGLTTTGVTVVNGDVALDPLATCTDATGNAGASQTCLVQTYASPTGMTVNGSIYWAGDTFDAGATALAVTNDLNTAWVEGMAKVDTLAGVLVGELGAPGPVGKIITPGVYNEANLGFAAGGVATFDAQLDANAIFIIKVGTVGGAGDFTDSGTLLLPTEIKLVNGAQARNIWFVVGRDATIGSGTTWNGNILAGRNVTVNDGSTVEGRVLAGAGGAGAFVLTGAASPSVTTISVP